MIEDVQNPSRRDFLKRAGVGAVGVAAATVIGGPSAFDELWEHVANLFTPKRKIYAIAKPVGMAEHAGAQLLRVARQDTDRELIIAKALDSIEGRTALAQAMVEPIRTSLMYQGIGRKLLMVDELPQGALPRYESDIAVKSYVIPKRGTSAMNVVDADELLIPIVELANHTTFKLNEQRRGSYYS